MLYERLYRDSGKEDGNYKDYRDDVGTTLQIVAA